MERSLSHTEAPLSSYSTDSSSTYASQSYGDSQLDVNGELVDFEGLAMGVNGMESADLAYNAQWLPEDHQVDNTITQPQTPAHFDWAAGGNMGYSTDTFDHSFPFQPFFAEPTAQPDTGLENAWLGPNLTHTASHAPYYAGYPAEPSTSSTTQEAYFGTDDGSISQPGTGLISPQAIFAPAFSNLPEAQTSNYGQYPPYHPQQYPSYQYPLDPAAYPQHPLPAMPQATYQMPHILPNDSYHAGRALSRCDSQSSGERIRTKTTLTDEHKKGIYAMSKLPNVRQQDIADKYNIDRSTVSKVITATRQKEERARNGDVIEPVVKVSKGGLARYPEIDAVVGNFIDTQATKGIIPPDQELRTLARDAAERLGIDFKASVKWLENFKVRRNQGESVTTESAKNTPRSTPKDHLAALPDMAVSISKSYSTTNLSELAGPSQARQRSQSSPQKVGVPAHQRPIPIRQSSHLAFTNARPTMTRSNSMNGHSKGSRGHRPRSSVGSPSLARSAFQLDNSLAPVQEDGSPARVQSRHRHTRSDVHGLGSWGQLAMSAGASALQHPIPLYPAPYMTPIQFQPTPRHAGPSEPKRPRFDSRPP